MLREEYLEICEHFLFSILKNANSRSQVLFYPVWD